MFTHQDIWVAIDELARRHGYSTSGLARKAGLDPTALNPSKRQSPEGKPRWPSTESISKILTVTQSNMQEFILLVEQTVPSMPAHEIPAISLDGRLSGRDFDVMGNPRGGRWVPATPQSPQVGLHTHNCYGLSVGNTDFEPVYRKGALLVACPDVQARTGDRILLCDAGGMIHMATLLPPKENHVVMRPVTTDKAFQIAIGDIVWVSRILWASQ